MQASISSEEEERMRIASELHDDVGATLSAIRLYVHQALRKPGDMMLIGQTNQLLDDCIQKVRDLSHRLQPSTLHYLGLVKALQSLAEMISRSGSIEMTVMLLIVDWPEPEIQISLSVYRIIQELVNNSIKHANASWIQLTTDKYEERYCISISHNGDGLTQAAYQEHVFKKGATGLKNIENRIKSANIDLIFTSDPKEVYKNRSLFTGGTSTNLIKRQLMNAPIKYMIVDDHTIFRQGLRLVLNEDPNLQLVAEVSDGLELLGMLKHTKPDIILLDLKMPKMDGIEATKEIKTKFPNIKILILTMHDDEQLILHVLESGANGYLIKNTDADEIKLALYACYENGFYFNDFISGVMLKAIVHRNNNPTQFNNQVVLSDKEQEVLKLICDGHTAIEIGKKIFLSSRTVEGIKATLLEKIGVRNTAGLIIYAVKQGIAI